MCGPESRVEGERVNAVSVVSCELVVCQISKKSCHDVLSVRTCLLLSFY